VKKIPFKRFLDHNCKKRKRTSDAVFNIKREKQNKYKKGRESEITTRG